MNESIASILSALKVSRPKRLADLLMRWGLWSPNKLTEYVVNFEYFSFACIPSPASSAMNHLKTQACNILV